mmetsp:Transcript_91606/g.179424  ORF Transcript_91606/g.179424 Transcript_91606/m.179424 type:complete len:205 (-) Transcript_91606:82-696(-)
MVELVRHRPRGHADARARDGGSHRRRAQHSRQLHARADAANLACHPDHPLGARVASHRRAPHDRHLHRQLHPFLGLDNGVADADHLHHRRVLDADSVGLHVGPPGRKWIHADLLLRVPLPFSPHVVPGCVRRSQLGRCGDAINRQGVSVAWRLVCALHCFCAPCHHECRDRRFCADVYGDSAEGSGHLHGPSRPGDLYESRQGR